jgi:tetratricopeptide (TPR) repeat protein
MIELVAARVRLLDLTTICDQMRHRLDLLSDGPRDYPERHRTARATISWSYALLSEDSQALLDRLSIFGGSLRLDAVAAVHDCEASDAIVTLSSLLEASLVQRSRSGSIGTWSVLQTIQAYAFERLEASADRDSVLLRYIQYYAALTDDYGKALENDAQERALIEIDNEIDNLRNALNWAFTLKRAEECLRLAAGLYRYWDIRGEMFEGRRWLDLALTLPGGGQRMRALALTSATGLAMSQADHRSAIRHGTEALDLFTVMDDNAGISGSLSNLGSIALKQGDIETAITHYERALAQEASTRTSQAFVAQHNLGLALCERDPDRALRLIEDCVSSAQQAGGLRFWAWANATLALAYLAKNETSMAERLQRQALEEQLRHGDRVGISRTLEGLAASLARSGRLEQAAYVLGAANVTREDTGVPVAGDYIGHRWAIEALRHVQDEVLACAVAEGRSAALGELVHRLERTE